MDCSKVGALIRALREEAGLTQLQLAENWACPTARFSNGSADAARRT